METDTNRLHLLYEVSRRLASFTDLNELLSYVTRRARELLDAEGCAVLLLDHARHEFYFPVASQRESREAGDTLLAEVRFPADRGVAGWVLEHGEAAAVQDAAHDARFYAGVDRLTNLSTRAILCAPLRTRSGIIGVIEVINPAHEAATDDLQLLEALASDIAVAHEKAALYAHLRGDVVRLYQLCRIAGLGLVILGIALGVGVTFATLAVALPLRSLPTRPGMLEAVGCLLAGLLLLGVVRRRRQE